MHLLFIYIFSWLLHPFFVSMTEIKYIPKNQNLEVSVRIFTDDLENTLRKNHPNVIFDILHPKDKALINNWIDSYIRKRLQIKTNEKVSNLHFIGYEQENESIWCYFETDKVTPIKKCDVFNTLLYDYKKEQINMIRLENGAESKSSKMEAPENTVHFTF